MMRILEELEYNLDVNRCDLLFAFDKVGLIRLDAHDAASSKFAIVDGVVGLGGEHALDVVASIAQNYSVSLNRCPSSSTLGCDSLDLKALKNRNGEVSLDIGVVEDGARVMNQYMACETTGGLGQDAYSKAPAVICCAASPILIYLID